MGNRRQVGAGYILLGGRSRRMGRDKALLEWHERPLAVWMAELVKRACGNVTLVGPAEKYSGLGFPLIEDVFEGQGPLGGIHAALSHSKDRLSLIAGCDMPYLTAEFLRFLLEVARKSGADAVVPESETRRLEPLCAVYATACRPAVEEALRNGYRKISQALERLRLRRVTCAEWRPLDPQRRLFRNLNTPQDYEAALQDGPAHPTYGQPLH